MNLKNILNKIFYYIYLLKIKYKYNKISFKIVHVQMNKNIEKQS